MNQGFQHINTKGKVSPTNWRNNSEFSVTRDSLEEERGESVERETKEFVVAGISDQQVENRSPWAVETSKS